MHLRLPRESTSHRRSAGQGLWKRRSGRCRPAVLIRTFRLYIQVRERALGIWSNYPFGLTLSVRDARLVSLIVDITLLQITCQIFSCFVDALSFQGIAAYAGEPPCVMSHSVITLGSTGLPSSRATVISSISLFQDDKQDLEYHSNVARS